MLQYKDEIKGQVSLDENEVDFDNIIHNRQSFDVHFSSYWRKKFGEDASLKIPVMGFKELDLFRLLQETLSFGGYNNVCWCGNHQKNLDS